MSKSLITLIRVELDQAIHTILFLMHPNIVSEAVPVKLGPHFQGHMKTQSFTPKNLHLGAQS